jgi:hypothetical protein
MWQAEIERIDGNTVGRRFNHQKIGLTQDGERATYAEVLDAWHRDEAFSRFFVSLLADAPYRAFRFETPPVRRDTIDQLFEFVLLDYPSLDCPADDAAFGAYFTAPGAEHGVVGFENLSKDAFLLTPTPLGAHHAYSHLAAFARRGPMAQQLRLWREVSEALYRRLSAAPIWLNTAGMAVAWLHIRLDTYPKYYGYSPYRNESTYAL